MSLLGSGVTLGHQESVLTLATRVLSFYYTRHRNPLIPDHCSIGSFTGGDHLVHKPVSSVGSVSNLSGAEVMRINPQIKNKKKTANIQVTRKTAKMPNLEFWKSRPSPTTFPAPRRPPSFLPPLKSIASDPCRLF